MSFTFWSSPSLALELIVPSRRCLDVFIPSASSRPRKEFRAGGSDSLLGLLCTAQPVPACEMVTFSSTTALGPRSALQLGAE